MYIYICIYVYIYIIVEKKSKLNNYSNYPRMCVLSTLCGNVDKHSPFDIYIYIYMYIYIIY